LAEVRVSAPAAVVLMMASAAAESTAASAVSVTFRPAIPLLLPPLLPAPTSAPAPSLLDDGLVAESSAVGAKMAALGIIYDNPTTRTSIVSNR
jgi:hypothetical protein